MTSNISQIVQENITQSLNCSHAEQLNDDPEGAAMYVIVVIGWYFLGVVAFVAWQMKKKSLPNDYKTELLSQNLEEQVKRKQIFEELRNPTMRKWAWSIYGSRGQLRYNPSDSKYEMQVLANLNKQLSEMDKRRLKYKSSFASSPESPSLAASNNDLLAVQPTGTIENVTEINETKKWRPLFFYKRRMRKKRRKSLFDQQRGARSLSMPSCAANVYSSINLSNQLQEKQKLKKKLSTLDELSSTEDF